MARFCLVGGTHDGLDDAGRWWMDDSPFVAFLRANGHETVSSTHPFVWSGDLNGLGGKHSDWRAGGNALFHYLVPPLCLDKRLKPSETNIICHSHGLQVVLYAAAYGLKIQTLISVSGPVRRDMELVATAARPQVARWVQIRSDRSDWWQWLGEIGDGRLGIHRNHPLADLNVKIPCVGHSGLLRDAEHFSHWTANDFFLLPLDPPQ